MLHQNPPVTLHEILGPDSTTFFPAKNLMALLKLGSGINSLACSQATNTQTSTTQMFEAVNSAFTWKNEVVIAINGDRRVFCLTQGVGHFCHKSLGINHYFQHSASEVDNSLPFK